jgi:hypothetical protein
LTNQVKDSELFSLLFMERTHGSELSRWNVPEAEQKNREVAATGSGQGLRNKEMVYTEQETSPLGLVLSDSESSTFRGSIIIQGNDWPKQEGITLKIDKIVRKQLFHLWWNLCAELYLRRLMHPSILQTATLSHQQMAQGYRSKYGMDPPFRFVFGRKNGVGKSTIFNGCQLSTWPKI